MKERPILFSAPMVRAILSGSKTQTRRVVRLGHGDDVVTLGAGDPYRWPWLHRRGRAASPYGEPCDRLWVRETFATKGFLTEFHSTGDPKSHGSPDDPCCAYAATGTYRCGKRIPDGALAISSHKWKPSIHMPRWASRLTLEVTSVRVERLHDISEDDIVAEGVTVPVAAAMTGIPWSDLPTLHHAWRAVWETINGTESWQANPWVWVVGFKRVEVVDAR